MQKNHSNYLKFKSEKKSLIIVDKSNEEEEKEDGHKIFDSDLH